jgi:hypothetical protein
MKKIFKILFAAFLLLGLTCKVKQTTFDVTLDLTNAQAIAVAFGGYYKINDGNEEAMTGTTPKAYDLILDKGDELTGVVYKSDSTNFTDTLHFRILINDEEQSGLTADVVIPTIAGGAQFQITVQ